ncbi:hypothetical protein L1987_43800 [Smallanthus sonchifolius]|uniref:Uncharacterized protein n=1 Tax=Smallanthus sonchifolius TaxID=185202 RepID=A0ACB9GMT2_9ASTR|nr:hypothetical protein L1987_43800 [Smallanthus sonchifolius]
MEKSKAILEDNLDSNTKQLVVVEEDDGYDDEEEEYLAICNEYKENEEHEFMISESGNHLILPAVSQVWMNHCTPPKDDDKHNKEHAKTDHEEEHNVNENQTAEELALEALNLQMVIVKDKTNVFEVNEDCEFDNEEKLEYEVKRLKKEVETSKLRVDVLVKEKTYIISERDMAMQHIEELDNMLKQQKLERDLEENIKRLSNEELETKSYEKADENQIENWDFLYKTNRLTVLLSWLGCSD